MSDAPLQPPVGTRAGVDMIGGVAPEPADKPRYQRIADELAHAIVNGQIAPGEKLPPQRVLAKRLGVTAGTVSRAYACLERQALTLARVGDGTYARNLDTTAPEPAAEGAARLIDLAHNVAIPTEDTQALQVAVATLSGSGAALAQWLQYQPEAGTQRHRAAGAGWLRRFGTGGDWHRVMVTHGAQHALAAVLRTVARPGETLLTESLSYSGALALARSLRLQVIGLEMDHEGLLPDALDRAARSFGSRLLFCTPSLHNPSNASMSMRRREAVAAVIREHHLLLLEDVVHAAAQAQPLPALSTLVPQQSFLLSSWSKVMAPGLRIGYLEASPQWLDKIAASIRSDCWMVAPLMAEIATLWLESGTVEHLIALQRRAIAERIGIARDCLQALPMRWADDIAHGWLALPQAWPADDFAARLRRAGVLVRTMEHFSAGRTPAPSAIRVSLNAAPSTQQLRQGLDIVAALWAGAASASIGA